MRFTAAEIFRSTIRGAPELHRQPPGPQDIALVFNDALLELLIDVLDMDEERLAARYVLPAAVVDADPVDLTDDGTGTGAREWLLISYIDWLDANGEGDEVVLVTLEARNRAKQEYHGAVVGHLSDQRRKLHKVTGWGSVKELEIYGVPAPTRVTPATIESTTFDFPSVLAAALRWELVLGLAPIVEIADGRIAMWDSRRSEARARLEADAHSVASLVEDVPIV